MISKIDFLDSHSKIELHQPQTLLSSICLEIRLIKLKATEIPEQIVIKVKKRKSGKVLALASYF